MARREVFYNFTEGPITFPPSYRFRKGAHTRDYSNVSHLKSSVYTTTVVTPPPSLEHPTRAGSNGPSTSSLSSSSQPTTATRVPSYTDRVLAHSLPGKRRAQISDLVAFTAC